MWPLWSKVWWFWYLATQLCLVSEKISNVCCLVSEHVMFCFSFFRLVALCLGVAKQALRSIFVFCLSSSLLFLSYYMFMSFASGLCAFLLWIWGYCCCCCSASQSERWWNVHVDLLLPCSPHSSSRTRARSPLHFPSQTPCVTPPSPVTSHCVTLTAVSLRHVTLHYARAGGNGGHYSRSYPRGWCKLLLVFLQSNDSSLLFSTPVIYHFPCPAPVVSPRQTKKATKGGKTLAEIAVSRMQDHSMVTMVTAAPNPSVATWTVVLAKCTYLPVLNTTKLLLSDTDTSRLTVSMLCCSRGARVL